MIQFWKVFFKGYKFSIERPWIEINLKTLWSQKMTRFKTLQFENLCDSNVITTIVYKIYYRDLGRKWYLLLKSKPRQVNEHKLPMVCLCAILAPNNIIQHHFWFVQFDLLINSAWGTCSNFILELSHPFNFGELRTMPLSLHFITN